MINVFDAAIERERLENKILAKEELNSLTAAIRDVNEYIYSLPRRYRDAFESDDKYLLFKGGRGGGKSISVCGHFIEESYLEKYTNTVFLFAREIAVSIEDSVYSLVVDLIQQAGKDHDFKILAKSITNEKTGVKFLFTGLRATGGKTAFSQINKIKGKHAISKIFIEEGQDITEDSLNTLMPTINRSGTVRLINEWRKDEDLFKESRFYVAMNPNFDNDPVVIKFRKLSRHRIEHINIFDIEPEFQDIQLMQQAEDEKTEIYYNHVWLGAASWKIDGYPFAEMQKVNYGAIPVAHTCFLDPSFAGGDFTAITFIGVIEGQLCAWGYCFKMGWSRCLDDIVMLVNRFKCQNNFYEENALSIVPQELLAERQCHFVGHLTLGNKENRIYKVAAYTAHRTKLLTNHSNSAYIKNILEYQDGVKHDDAPDSFASCMIKGGIVSEKMKF